MYVTLLLLVTLTLITTAAAVRVIAPVCYLHDVTALVLKLHVAAVDEESGAYAGEFGTLPTSPLNTPTLSYNLLCILIPNMFEKKHVI